MQQKNIMIAVDGSDHSFETIRYVGNIIPPIAIAARIKLFHIMNPFPETFWDLEIDPENNHASSIIQSWKQRQEKFIQQFMEQALQLLKDAGFSEDTVTVDIKERQRGIARDIADEAQRGYDAVVVGRRGYGDVEDLILGSIANKLVNRLHHFPIWVVGGCPDPNKILVAMDSSDGAMRALEHVYNFLDKAHPHLLLLNVIRSFNDLQADKEQSSPLPSDNQLLEVAEKEMHKAKTEMSSIFDHCIRKLEQKGADLSRIETKIVTGAGSRAGTIVEEAQKGAYGTIVIGRRGLSKVQEFFMGRVCNKVLQLAKEMSVFIIN
ncbi:MAG: universal stress protein [Deltaproteobacteria bacterium]|nr:universal stress protein [Deltaproteobacteria bacterium]